MRLLSRFAQYWPVLLACAAALLGLALLWLARDMPLQPAPAVRIDALSAFFIFALLAGAALAVIASAPTASAPIEGAPYRGRYSGRALALAALLLVAWTTTLTPVVVVAYMLVALLSLRPTTDHRPLTTDHQTPMQPPTIYGGPAVAALRRMLRGAPTLVAAGALLVGYGALAMRGALRYDTRTAGAALDGFAFWFVLLAAAIPTTDHRLRIEDRGSKIDNPRSSILDPRSSIFDPLHPFTPSPLLFQIVWLYPLARLYSLGPWNSGWSFAALLLGGGAALWAALAAIIRPGDRRRLTLLSYQGMALAGFGLSSGAGIAAGCYAVLAYLVLALPKIEDRGWRMEDRRSSILDPRSSILDPQPPSPAHRLTGSPTHWLLSGAVPCTAPFVAAWMLVGASVAGGVTLLAGAVWLAMLLNGLAAALARDTLVHEERRPLLVAAGASVLLGVAAPLVVLALIQPVVEQLQGGLTPYGDVNIWPWIGLASVDSARAQVTTLPSIAVAALMLVLSALVYLIVRLRDTWAPAGAATDSAPRLGELLASLRAEVPWLAALGPRPAGEERHIDGE
jgi:hypothetical protein